MLLDVHVMVIDLDAYFALFYLLTRIMLSYKAGLPVGTLLTLKSKARFSLSKTALCLLCYMSLRLACKLHLQLLQMQDECHGSS